jgi:large subunit ribosomal protein L23
MKNVHEILIRPILTEKMHQLQEKQHKYAFAVRTEANKIQVKQAVEKKFDVSVDNVRTVLVKGKRKQMNTRRGITRGSTPNWKKAVVTLRAGDSIDYFEGSSG